MSGDDRVSTCIPARQTHPRRLAASYNASMNPRAFGREIVDAGLEATIVGSFSNIGYAARRRLFAWDTESFRDMSGRVAVVTGASGGLGLAATKLLARRGCKVWLVGRDETHANAAAHAVVSDYPRAQVAVALADFAALE